MGLWIEDGTSSFYITDRGDATIRWEYDKRRKELGLGVQCEMSGQQRRDFDRAMLRKYGAAYPPPPRTPYLLKIWSFLEESGQI